jgi:hypothetical protein
MLPASSLPPVKSKPQAQDWTTFMEWVSTAAGRHPSYTKKLASGLAKALPFQVCKAGRCL